MLGSLLLSSVLGSTSCTSIKHEYEAEVLVTKEHELRTALSQIREVLNLYAIDFGHPPSTLEDLVTAGYINGLPDDPLTGKKDWLVVYYDCSKTVNCKSGVQNVHTSSSGKSKDGTLYRDW